jgi:hypothetical protein
MSQQEQQEIPADEYDMDELLDKCVKFVKIERENDANSLWWPCVRFTSMQILHRVTKKWNLYVDAASMKERGKLFLHFLPGSNSIADAEGNEGALLLGESPPRRRLLGENPPQGRYIFDNPDTPLSFMPLLENIVEICDQYRDDSEFMKAVMVVQSMMKTGPVSEVAFGSLTTAAPPHAAGKSTVPSQVALPAASTAAIMPLSRKTNEKGPLLTGKVAPAVTSPNDLPGRIESGQKRKAASSVAVFASNQNSGGQMPPLKKSAVPSPSSATTRQESSRHRILPSPAAGRVIATRTVTAPRHRLMESPPKRAHKADELEDDASRHRTSRSGRRITLSRAHDSCIVIDTGRMI